MPVDLHFEICPTYLNTVAVGTVSPIEAQDIFAGVLKACREHRQPLVLLDWRQLDFTVPLTTLHRFEFANLVAEQVVHLRARELPGIRLAFVIGPAYLDPKRFGETVATNRGVTLKVTDSLAEALAWLGVEPPGDPDTP